MKNERGVGWFNGLLVSTPHKQLQALLVRDTQSIKNNLADCFPSKCALSVASCWHPSKPMLEVEGGFARGAGSETFWVRIWCVPTGKAALPCLFNLAPPSQRQLHCAEQKTNRWKPMARLPGSEGPRPL